jgi:hypothetical protein
VGQPRRPLAMGQLWLRRSLALGQLWLRRSLALGQPRMAGVVSCPIGGDNIETDRTRRGGRSVEFYSNGRKRRPPLCLARARYAMGRARPRRLGSQPKGAGV